MCACIHAYARVRARENFLIKKKREKRRNFDCTIAGAFEKFPPFGNQFLRCIEKNKIPEKGEEVASIKYNQAIRSNNIVYNLSKCKQ